MKFPSILPDILMCSFVTVLDVYKKPNCRHGSFHFYNYVKRSISCLGIESKYWLEVVKPCFIRNGYWWVTYILWKLCKKIKEIFQESSSYYLLSDKTYTQNYIFGNYTVVCIGVCMKFNFFSCKIKVTYPSKNSIIIFKN